MQRTSAARDRHMRRSVFGRMAPRVFDGLKRRLDHSPSLTTMHGMPGATPDDVVSHFRLIERIGQGGMGQVWLAEDTSLPRRVVVKLLHPHLDEDPDAIERLF